MKLIHVAFQGDVNVDADIHQRVVEGILEKHGLDRTNGRRVHARGHRGRIG